MQTSKLLAVAALTIVAVAGCGSGATGGGAGATAGTAQTAGPAATAAAGGATPAPVGAATQAPAADPAAVAAEMCGLLTAADLKTVTGDTYGAGVPDEFGNCTWRVGAATVNNGKGQVTAAIQAASLATIEGTFPGGTKATVGGHDAYWNGAEGLGSMWVDVSGRLFVLAVSPIVDDSQATAQKLAEVAVGKM